MDDLKQALYLIADEMRGMATIGRHFAGNIYEVERAHRIMELAAKVAALVDEHTPGEVKAIFEAEPWLRYSPSIGAEAAVFNANNEILLIQRKDKTWAMPGGVAEIGQTFPEAALRELWEEAGLRGRVVRLLGVFDARLWGPPAKVHYMNMVFQIVCYDLMPAPGIECLDARFFAREKLPEAMHGGHGLLVAKCFELLDSAETYFDPADSLSIDMPMHQRTGGEQDKF